MVEVYSGGCWGCHRCSLEGRLVFLKKVMVLCSVCFVSIYEHRGECVGEFICVFVGWRYKLDLRVRYGRLCDIR